MKRLPAKLPLPIAVIVRNISLSARIIIKALLQIVGGDKLIIPFC